MSRTRQRSRMVRHRLPLRTKAVSWVVEQLSERTVATMTPQNAAGIRERMALPARAPFTWLVGRPVSDVDTWQTQFTTRDGAARAVRVHRPQAPGRHPVIIHFHGGGFVLGDLPSYDPLCSTLAREVPAVVLSVDYRMAPEHRAPQAVLDAVDAVRWAADYAPVADGDPDRIALVGDSAGGNLAAVSTHVIRDEGGPRISHQGLIYPATDLTMSFPSIRARADGPWLTVSMMRMFSGHYLGPDGGIGLGNPLVSPYWREDLSDLPPALVQTADMDPLRDEGQAYAARLAQAGVEVRATNYLAGVHGFVSFPGTSLVAAQALSELVTEQRRYLGQPTADLAPEPVGPLH
ncbi:MAG: alpha/beta hydrolase [Dermatophilaceae bacterium]